LRLLAFDTQGPLLSAVAAECDAVIAERAEAAERGQADRILPLLEEVLALAGWGWRSVELLAVTVGPGGFTAIRTGLAAARALALALDRPAIGIGTLEAMAEVAFDVARPGPLLVLKDLRREQMAVQGFGPDLKPDALPRLLGRDEALAAAMAAPRLAGDGALLLRPFLLPTNTILEAVPSARYGARAAWRRVTRGERLVAGTELRPFYLRPADAQLAAGRPLVAPLAAP
jgi:tRNA threonylcarbamoyladenosine biosynthesis protein TsaB